MKDEDGQVWAGEQKAGPTPPKLVTVDEFARQVTVSRATAWELIRDGLVESVKIGNLRRVPAAAIDAYVDTLRTQTRSVRCQAGAAADASRKPRGVPRAARVSGPPGLTARGIAQGRAVT